MTNIRRSTNAAAGLEREKGLARQLSTRQMAMMAIGGAIGTGLFLGSSLTLRMAGPAVILSYVLGAVIALLLMGALSEMALAHPTAGSFGLYAELYVSRWAGFVARYTYWACQCIAIGSEATAAAIYMRWWFPQVPAWAFIVGFALLITCINATAVGNFGEFEYWFAMIKVIAIVLFVAFGLMLLAGLVPGAHAGAGNFTRAGGFFPHGVKGMWMAMAIVIFSYIGTEVVAVTAGEAKDPAVAVPKAMRSMLARLVLFYVGAIIVLVGIVPWDRVQPGGDVTASPFVTVFQLVHIPAATHVMNFVVLTAALSSMNCNLYLATRMMFSLSRSGDAPEVFGRVNRRSTPLAALLLSTVGLVIAACTAALYPGTAYVFLLGVALFGGLFVWIMIFFTHLKFRRAWTAEGRAPLPVRMWGYPYTTIAGMALVTGIVLTTWWTPGMRPTILAGVPWLIFLSLIYALRSRRAWSR